MHRREFLASSVGLAASAPPLTSLAATASAGRAATDPAKAWQQVFAQTKTDYEPVNVGFQGRLPAALRGTLFRNGPGLMQRGDTRFRHWFDGDGLIQSYQIGDGRLTHQARSVRTERFKAEQAAGRYLWDGFGTSFAGARPTARPDDLNPANISMLDTGDELLALWEAGSPYRIDPRSLETLGRKVYSQQTDGMPFTAHPRVDNNGTIWSFGYMAGSGRLALYQMSRMGALLRTSLIEAPNADMVHDFAITERYLVFVLMPLLAGERGSARSMLERYRWHAQQATVVLLIDKDTLTVRHRAELPAAALFHLGNAWEDGQQVRIEFMRIGNFDHLMAAMYASIAGQPIRPFTTAEDGATDIVVDLERRAARYETLLERNCDFPAFDKRATGRRSDELFVLRRSSNMATDVFGLNQLTRIDRKRQQIQSFDFGDDEVAEEHLFVPTAGTTIGNGWLIGTSYDWVRRQTRLNVFNAQAISDGPIARATLPRAMPPGLHGIFRSNVRRA